MQISAKISAQTRHQQTTRKNFHKDSNFILAAIEQGEKLCYKIPTCFALQPPARAECLFALLLSPDGLISNSSRLTQALDRKFCNFLKNLIWDESTESCCSFEIPSGTRIFCSIKGLRRKWKLKKQQDKNTNLECGGGGGVRVI
jgi:hypothetical protein